MDGERISLRLEPEDLELIDEFVDKHPEFSNRSHLARMAIREFIENRGAQKQGKATHHAPKKNVITVEVPALAHLTIEDFIRAGVYNSMEDAVVEVIRERFITPESRQKILRQQSEAIRTTVEVLDK